ncbi:MAG: insulinase family protein, partial [Lewinella sp.]|nr:insulinase family protein [Lewinella sp.]
KDLADAEMILKNTLDSLAENPPTAAEVERAKTRLVKNFELGVRQSDRFGLEMSEYLSQGDWRLAFIYRDRLEEVTVDQVIAVAERYFKPSNRTVGRFLPTPSPERAEIPDVPDVAALVDGYVGREAMAEGEAFDPSYENIEARTDRGETGSTLEYALLPKETRGDAVVARLSLRFGDLSSLRGKGTAASFAGMMLNKGTESYTRQEIEDRLDELKARVRIGGGASGAYAIIETERDMLPEVIDLVGEMFQHPTFPEEEFTKLVDEQLAGIDEGRSEPTSIASREFSRHLENYSADDPRYTMTFDEEVEAIKGLTLEDVKAFHESFYGASDATIGIVGDFDEAAVTEALNRNFRSWSSPSGYERLVDPYYEVKPEDVEVETPDKANAMFLAGMNIEMDQDDPDYPAMVLGNFMLGGGFLNSRLATRIRQEEGLSYGVGSFFNASPMDENATWGAYAIYAPENVEALQAAFVEEIEKAITDGFTPEEVAAAQSGWVQNQQVSRAQDNSLAGTLNNYLYLDRTMEWDAELEAKVSALTAEDINAAMARHLDPEKLVFIKAGDFAKHRAARP